MNTIVGTAGHIDHGKTALVKALTGVDADRFPEEKERGITIDIGFAELDLGDVRIGFVDVPGHEKFVKNMLAGASGIDLVMLVIAADEGVMPQTREHFEICRLLEVRSGLIVLTKKDLADPELLEIARLDALEMVAGSFLEKAPVVAVSAHTGEGIEELKDVLRRCARQLPERETATVARLPIDRSFSVKGFGAVVTGTLAAGEIDERDELEILPDGKKVRVRGLQTHGQKVPTARAGQRTAVNLGGVEHGEIERGMLLTRPDVLRPTQILDAEIEVLKDAPKAIRSRQRVRVHIGTLEALARIQVLNESGEIKPGERDLAQIRLETAVAAIPGERFILRQYSPQMTIAGGRVLDTHAARHRKKDLADTRRYLTALREATDTGDRAGQLKLYLERARGHGLDLAALQARTGWHQDVLDKALAENIENRAIVEAERFYAARSPFDELKQKTLAAVEDFHRREPLARGMLRETLREKIFARLPAEIFRAVLKDLEEENRLAAEQGLVRLAAHSLELSEDEEALRVRLREIYRTAGLAVPKLEEALAAAAAAAGSDSEHARQIFQLLLNSGEIVKVSEEFYFSEKALSGLIAKLRDYATAREDRLIDVPAFKEIAGVSRKYAIPLLEYLDVEKVTRRAGDKRLIL